MKLFNTLTNKKEEFKPIREGEVSIYVCGPTVYNYVHIGNTRPMIVFDILRRTFEYLGYKVIFVSNFTDVDDKIIKAAKEEGVSEKELTDKYIQAYEDVRRDLNLLFPTYAPRVTNTMDAIINFIDDLAEAYRKYCAACNSVKTAEQAVEKAVAFLEGLNNVDIGILRKNLRNAEADRSKAAGRVATARRAIANAKNERERLQSEIKA